MVYKLISVEYQLERPKRLIINSSLIISAMSLLPVNLRFCECINTLFNLEIMCNAR
jgi:hypothetical protein